LLQQARHCSHTRTSRKQPFTRISHYTMENLLGATLLTKSGQKATADALQGAEVVGLYFSAHWCPPCRGFTPKLGEFYNSLKATKSFEIVFVSSDRDDASFTEYYGEHAPWCALPFEDRSRKEALSKQFKVQGIPALVLVDGTTGEVITTDARSSVAEDPEGVKFPWKPATLAETLASMGDLLTKKTGASAVPIASLAASPIFLYFSAHWCPPCKAFTPQLVTFFDKLVDVHPNCRIVFVSSDRDNPSFTKYYKEMGTQWLALPFGHPAKSALSKAFGIDGIPSLVLLGPEDAQGDRKVITHNARECVVDNVIENFPTSWADKPYADISKTTECSGEDINNMTSIIVLADTLDDPQPVIEALKTVAVEAETKRSDGDDVALLFFFSTVSTGPVARLRELCDCAVDDNKGKVTFIKLDIPDQGGYYTASADDVSPDAIRAFMANPGPRQQLSG